MNKLIRFGILTAFVGAGVSGAAYADSASTTGGFKIKSDDGNFEASIGGRIHLDAAYLDPDSEAFGSGGANHFGSDSLDNASGVYFRRVFLTLQGKAYGWEYKVEDDLTGGERGGAPATTTTTNVTTAGTCTTTSPSAGKYTTTCTAPTVTSTSTTTTFPEGAGFQDLYIAHSLGGPDGTVYFGQHKPWRSFEELQSNNEILFMERPVTSSSGILGGRDFQDGLFYKYSYKPYGLWAGTSVYSLSKVGQASTQGAGGNGRIAWAPLNKTGELVHVGFSYSSDHADNGTALTPSYRYAGYGLNTNDVLTLASYKGTSGVSAGKNATANTWTGELAGIYGPVYLEGEYAHQGIGAKSVGQSSSVEAYYIQSSVFLTGEGKSYKTADAVVAGNPKPLHSYGAVEVKVRFESIKNNSIADTSATTTNAATLGCTATGAPAQSKTVLYDQCKTTDIAAGINYYVNPNVRFMIDYVMATTDLGTAGKDKPNTIAGRVQLAF